MPATERLPAVDDCIDLYRRAYDRHGTEPFDPGTLRRDDADGAAGGDGRDPPADVAAPTRLLDLLAAYGLLDRYRDGRYRVRCAPDEPLDRWRARAVDRAESLHRRVHRAGPTPEAPGDDGREGEVLRHEGEAFASVRVAEETDLASTRAAVRAARSACPDCAGVVLRSSGELAARVQRLADALCEATATSEESRFEKLTTDLVGPDKDDLEFRLFLGVTA